MGRATIKNMHAKKGFSFRSSLTKSGKKDMRFATGMRRSSAQRRGDSVRGYKTRGRAAGKKLFSMMWDQFFGE